MSDTDKDKLYKDLSSAYTKTYSDVKTKKQIQDNVNVLWNNLKKTNLTTLVESEIVNLNKVRVQK